MKKKPQIRGVIFSLLLMSIALLELSVLYGAGASFQERLFNSDALYLPVLLSDIWQHGLSISQWYLTPAPYFFPDALLFSGLIGLSSDPYTQIFLFLLLQTSLLWAVLWFLIQQISPKNAVYLSTAACTFFIWLAVNVAEPFQILLISAHHFGILMTGLLFIALWLRYIQRPFALSQILSLIFMGILAFLSTLSDNLFLVQIMAPFLVTDLLFKLLLRQRPIWKIEIPIAFLTTMACLGLLAYPLLVTHSTRYPATLILGKVGASIVYFLPIMRDFFSRFPGFFFFLCINIAICIIYSMRFLNHTRSTVYTDTHFKNLVWLAWFGLFSGLISIAVIFTTSETSIGLRYLLPAFYIPVICSIVLPAYHLKSSLNKIFCIGISSICLISLGYDAYQLTQKNGLSTAFYPAEIACIDDALRRHQLSQGIAQYWDARHIETFSRLDLSIAQYTDKLQEYRWISSETRFKSSYDFAIISHNVRPQYTLQTDLLAAKVPTKPLEQIKCGQRTLLIYGKDQLYFQQP